MFHRNLVPEMPPSWVYSRQEDLSKAKTESDDESSDLSYDIHSDDLEFLRQQNEKGDYGNTWQEISKCRWTLEGIFTAEGMKGDLDIVVN